VSEFAECLLKIVVAVGAVTILIALARGRMQQHRRRILQALTVVGALAYINFGGFHTDGTPLHLWDQYHYFVGSKYFPQLGYDGLYVATIEARKESHPELAPPQRVRDLRTGELVPLASVADHTAEVRKRFSDEQWRQFSEDVGRFYIRDDVFLDSGLKATPTHIQVLRLLSSHLSFRTRNLMLVASLDFILLGVAGFAVYRAFGLATLAAVSLCMGLGFCSRYYWVGGAFLRHDWLAALFIAAALLRFGRLRWAALALAYATTVRIFPGLFAVPICLYWLAAWRRGESLRPLQEFVPAFVVCVVGLVAIGWIAEPAAWSQSIAGLLVHSRTIFPNSVGLRVPFITSLANFRGELVNPQTLYDYVAVSKDYASLMAERAWLVVLASVAMVGFTVRAAWRAPDAVTAFALGTALVFALTAPTCYYGTFFALLPLARPVRTSVTFLMGTALCFLVGAAVIALSRAGYLTFNGAAVFGPVSLIMAIVMVDWLRTFPCREPGVTALRGAFSGSSPSRG
jgi:hypothetical protein